MLDLSCCLLLQHTEGQVDVFSSVGAQRGRLVSSPCFNLFSPTWKVKWRWWINTAVSPNSPRWDIRCVRRRCRLPHLAAHPQGAWAPVAPATPSHTLRVTVIWWCLGSSWSPGRADRPCSPTTTLPWLRTSLSATAPSQSSPGQNTHVFVPGQTESVLQLILKLST